MSLTKICLSRMTKMYFARPMAIYSLLVLVGVIIYMSYGLFAFKKTYVKKQLHMNNSKHIHMKKHNHPNAFTFKASKGLPYFFKLLSLHPNDIFRQKQTINNYTAVVNHSTNQSKLILIYNPPTWFDSFKTACSAGVQLCPIKDCRCSDEVKDLSQSDAVIINAVDLRSPDPPIKYSNQVWIFYGIEPPLHYETEHFRSRQWSQMFNWTMTYRLDSDIIAPYDVLVELENISSNNFTAIALRKSKSALWLVSDCQTQSERENYVEELRQYYDVDIHGRCRKHNRTDFVQNEYRFYLAFENSLCDDYVTEKLFKIYDRNINLVPIVRGRVKYASLFPNDTYINTDQFSSPRKLAEYLRYLERNITAYAEILRQKKRYIRVGDLAKLSSPFCDVCMKLHNLDVFSNHYYDVAEWLERDICHEPDDYSKKRFKKDNGTSIH